MKTNSIINILLPKDGKPLESLDQYKRTGGLAGLQKAYKLSRNDVIAAVKKSGLRGRGGAGFPTGIKWESVASDPCEIKYVVCNAAEGEPGTYKDRFMLQKNPYQLIEGMLIACYAIKAKQGVIGIKEKFTREVNRLELAITEMEKDGVMPKGFIEIYCGPDDYLFGEEKGLVEAIDGGGALPRVLPPYMLGIRYTPNSPNPACVNNAESLSNLPHIFANGVDWYLSIGVPECPGTMIFTLSGDVKYPGIYELPMGTPMRELLYTLGGGPVGEFALRAVFSGVANPVATPRHFDTPLDFVSMRRAGIGLGSAGFMCYDESVCMVKATLMISTFLSQSSCGQCIPCNKGTSDITELLKKLDSNCGRAQDLQSIHAITGRLTDQTRCYLPAQEQMVVPSMIREFPDDFRRHTEGPCYHDRQLLIPKIESFDEKTRAFTYECKAEHFIS